MPKRDAGTKRRSASGGDADNIVIPPIVGIIGDSGDIVDGANVITGATNPAECAGHTEPVGSAGDGDSHNGTVSDPGNGKRGRGRPRGSTNTKKPGAFNISVSGIEKLLLGIHETLYRFTGAPELELKADDAKQLAEAYRDVALHYPTLALDDKTAAVLNMIGVSAGVYGTRLAAFRLRMWMQHEATKGSKPAPVPQPVKAADHAPGMNGNAPGAPVITPKVPDKEIRTGEIAGVGTVEFPADHPLVRGPRH